MVIPLEFSLCLIALLEFPKNRAGWIKSTYWYSICLSVTFILVVISAVSILWNFSTLMQIDTIFLLKDFTFLGYSLYLSLFSLIILPIWLVFYLLIASYVSKKF